MPLAAALSVDLTPYAQIVDRSALIHFTFIVFFTPRLVVFTDRDIYVHLYNVQRTQFVSAISSKAGHHVMQLGPAARIWQSSSACAG
jgi:hypothetical protein